MARKGKVFNRLGRPKLLRKVISRTETVVGAVLLLSIIAMTDAMRACPEGVDIATRLKLAQQLLA